MMSKTAAFVFAGLSMMAACGPAMRDDGTGDDDGMGSGSGSGSGSDMGTPRQCEKMDIVFVVDNSGSMQEEQSNLASNFPMFASLLQNYQVNGAPLDFRVAITTTGRTVDYTIDLGGGLGTFPEHEDGQNGAFQNNCNSNKRWIDSTDANIGTTLGCRANVGTSGPSVEMPLLMSKWSLSERAMDGTQNGFMRQDALLAVVMLTDEDDQSTTQNNFTMDASGTTPTDWNPSDEVGFLDNLKGNRTRWAAAAIAGDGDCSSNFGSAANAQRLKDFVNLANGQGSTQAVFSSICDGNLTTGLQHALDTFQAACGQIIL